MRMLNQDIVPVNMANMGSGKSTWMMLVMSIVVGKRLYITMPNRLLATEIYEGLLKAN